MIMAGRRAGGLAPRAVYLIAHHGDAVETS
jgi:hypothetical protein